MTTISLVRKAVNRVDGTNSYRMDFNINAVTGFSTTKLFLKKRWTRFDGQVMDEFAAVCSPSDIEDYPEDNPNTDSAYYRTDSISLASSDPALLDESCNTIVMELQMIAEQMDVLDGATDDKVYSIQADQVTEDDVPNVT